MDKEENHKTIVDEDRVHLNKITLQTCQVKTEPESEEEEDSYELESTAENYPDSYVMKPEIVEMHIEDHPMMDNERNQKETSKHEDSVHLNKTTSLTCRVKTEPESEEEEDGYELESTGGNYPDIYVIKREIVEVHTEDHPMMYNEENHKATKDEDSLHLTKITSLTCQVKIEPESEEDFSERESTAGNYTASYVIKREIVEEDTVDHHMMDNEENLKTTKDEDSGTEANRVTKSDNANWSPNFPDNNINEQNNIFQLTKKMNKQEICGRMGKKTKMSLTQDKTLCRTKNNHKCSVCAKAFRSSQACLQHMWNAHTGENPYTCEVCGKGFKYLSCLQTHKRVHSDERPFSCDVCDKAFKQKNVLQYHKMSCHSNERPYSCDLCDKAFKYKRNLQIHKVLCHSDERPYSCDLCEKTFKLKNILDSHKKKVHSVERPYSCDLCNKAFKEKRHLQRHKISWHSNERSYSCDLCDKAFKSKAELQIHKMLRHSVERPYSCDLCDKTFKLKQTLDSHKATVHSNERPYSCDLCEKSFKLKGHLNTHKRTVHSDSDSS